MKHLRAFSIDSWI